MRTIMIMFRFQEEVVENVRQGYTGNNPGVRVWTFSSSLMFSLSIFTTIGMYYIHSKARLTSVLYRVW